MNRNRSGRRYDREFKNNAVALVRAGRTITEVPEIWASPNGRWGTGCGRPRKVSLLSEPKTLTLGTPEQRELLRLRHENDYLRRQREILKALGMLRRLDSAHQSHR
jgi:transposase